MAYWSWWIGGAALASVALLHWALAGSLLSVSSRFTGVVDRARGAVASPSAGSSSAEPLRDHLAFFGGAIGGGLIATLVASGGRVALELAPGETFARFFGGSPVATALVLGVGGVLVGVGTRMARGCTSGHGLCGVARVQPGSLLATAAFFGTGVVVSIAIGGLLG